MRGSISGLELSDSIRDLALTYHATVQSIALQTRHIVESLNAAGHKITAIYMSGGQAKNAMLMQLFADVCQMQVVLPADHALAVVLGSAILGRFAHESQERKEAMDEEGQADALWNIMVWFFLYTIGAIADARLQVEMTPPGKVVYPLASSSEAKLLEAKYKIFLESIEIQQRWRREIEEACR